MKRTLFRCLIATCLCGGPLGGIVGGQGLPGASWQAQVGNMSVAVVPKPAVGVVPDPYVVRVQPHGGVGLIEIDIGAGSLDWVKVFDGRRLVVSMGNHIRVVDLMSNVLVDDFSCSRTAVSADARYVAFVPVTPRWLDVDRSVYLVYDVSAQPSVNRMDPMPQSGRPGEQAGIAVFTEVNRVTRLYEIPEDNALVESHALQSPIKWLDSHRFAFLDYQEAAADGRLSVVVVNLIAGVSNPDVRRQSINASEIVDMSKMGNAKGARPGPYVTVTDIVPVVVTPTAYTLRLLIGKSAGTLVAEVNVDL